ncbi:GNAT family N-acetyltransferase [Acidiplasma cupricumulans]|uniref:GNAT family N-acetyltransferase n=1 Tax=Acidiplasma cupricumulans TaxID=312540 RepID=UPI0007814A75|nr:GNAT family N-acetyltransferase [Acidiplasma cupricumulans]
MSWKYAYKNIYTDEYIDYWINKYYALDNIKNDIEKSINNKILFYGLFDNNLLTGFIEIDKINKIILRFYLMPDYIKKCYGTKLLKTAEEIIRNEKLKN